MAGGPSDTAKVLLALREGAAEGYSLLSRTGLPPDLLSTVLRGLLAREMIFVKGGLEPDRIGDAYISMRPSARSLAEQMLYKEMP
jgi:hypothetical protein